MNSLTPHDLSFRYNTTTGLNKLPSHHCELLSRRWSRLACVASVSNRVTARKLEREQKKKGPNFLDELARKRLLRRLVSAGAKIYVFKRILHFVSVEFQKNWYFTLCLGIETVSSSIAAECKDGHGLKLVKVGSTLSFI